MCALVIFLWDYVVESDHLKDLSESLKLRSCVLKNLHPSYGLET